MKYKRIAFMIFSILAVMVIAMIMADNETSGMSLDDKYVGNKMVDIEWSEYGGGDFSHYNIYRNDAKTDSYYNSKDTFHREEGLNSGDTYTMKVEVVNNTGVVKDTRSITIKAGDVQGTITKYTTWDDAEYKLTNNVVVDKNATLSIQSGTTVYTYTRYINVKGSLLDLDTVTISGRGITINGDTSDMDRFQVDDCEFNGAEGGFNPGYALTLTNLDVQIWNSDFSGYDAGVYVQGDSPYLYKNDFVDIEGRALYVKGPDYAITECTITRCGQGMELNGVSGLVSDNTIRNNTDYAIQSTGGNNSEFLNNVITGNNQYGFKITGADLKVKNNQMSFNSYTGIWGIDVVDLEIRENEIISNDGWGIYLQTGDKIDIYMNTIDDNYQAMYIAYCTNTTIQENNVTGFGKPGIVVTTQCWDLTVTHNRINDCINGLDITGSRNLDVMFNTITHCSQDGLSVYDTFNCTVSWNILRSNNNGIDLTLVEDGEIKDNTMENHDTNAFDLIAVTNVRIHTHTIDGLNGSGVFMNGCHHVTIEHFTITNASNGIQLYQGDNTIIQQCSLYNNTKGISLWGKMDNCTVTGNDFMGNENGIYVSQTEGMLIEENEFYKDVEGILVVYESKNNTIKKNEFELCTDYAIHTEEAEKNSIERNTINGTGHTSRSDEGTGIYIERSNNVTAEWNTITNSSMHGIMIYDWSARGDNTLLSNEISDSSFYGIQVMRSNNNLIQRNSVTRCDGWGAIMIKWCDENELEENTVFKNENNGIYIQGSHSGDLGGKKNLVGNNTIEENGEAGIILNDANRTYANHNFIGQNKYGILIQATSDTRNHNNTFFNDTIEEDQNDDNSCSISLLVRDGTFESTIFKEVKIGLLHQTSVTITSVTNGSYTMKAVEEPPDDPAPPDYPFKKTSIDNYIEIISWDENATLFLIFHYEDEDLTAGTYDDYTVPAESLKVWRYGVVDDARGPGGRGDPVWRLGNEDGEEPWNGSRMNEIGTNSVGVEIRKFSIFAPLASLPVHNLDTNKDFATINEALDDVDTYTGQTITVDPEYTGEEEDIVFDFWVILKSSSGNPEDTVIQGLFENKDTITIEMNYMHIEGFTIRGTATRRAIWSDGFDNITIKNCILTNNQYGLHLQNGEDWTIQDCIFQGNTDGGLYLEDGIDVAVENCQFMDPIGMHILRTDDVSIYGCTFDSNADIGIYTYDSNHLDIIDNDFNGPNIGIYMESSMDNEMKNNDFFLVGDTGIRLDESDENTISGGTMDSVGTGVIIWRSEYNTVEDITMKCEYLGDLVGVLVFNSAHNTIDTIAMEDFVTATGTINGIRIMGFSPNNEIMNINMKRFTSGTINGIFLNSSWNYFRNIRMEFFYGGVHAIGVNITGCNNNTLKNVHIKLVNSSDVAVGVRVNDGEKITLTEFNVTMVSSHEHTGKGVLVNDTRSCNVGDSLVSENEKGISCENGSTPDIHWNAITGNMYDGLVNQDAGVTVNAENNWWGDTTGPSGTAAGLGDPVSANVDYTPWIGATYTGVSVEEVTAGTGTLDTRDTSDTTVNYDATGDAVITTFMYDENPGEGFDGNVGKYIDVHIDDADDLNELEIRMYYTTEDLNGKDERKLRMTWWNGEEWAQCSDSGVEYADVDGYAGYLWARIGTDTSPSLEDLSGTPFGGIEDQDVETVTYTMTIVIDSIDETIEPGKDIIVSGYITTSPETPPAMIKTVKILLDGSEVGTAAINGTRFIATISLPQDLAEGDHTILVNCTLESGEMNEKSTTIKYEKEEDKDDGEDDDDGVGMGIIIVILIVVILVVIVALVQMGIIQVEGFGPSGDKGDPGKEEEK